MAEAADYQCIEGLHVLRVSGSDYDMAFQHGQRLRAAIAQGPLAQFPGFLTRLLQSSMPRPIATALAWGLARTVGARIARNLPAHAAEALRGLSDGSEISYHKVLRAVTLPETLLWLQARSFARKGLELAPRAGIPQLGCTSAAAWGSATRDGQLLHGRNFDYYGVGIWDRQTAVVFHQPEVGQPFVAISAAGVPFGGVTAMNQAGLTLAVHQHGASADASISGTPVGITGDEVMRHAHSLDDARRLLDAHVPNGCWTYIVTSGRERAVLCYEVTPAARGWFLAAGDTFGYTNVFLHRRLAARELHVFPSYWRANVGRYQRVQELLATQHGQLDPDGFAAILGDRGDPVCRIRAAVAMLLTVGSVVFRPVDGSFWVATGRAPVSNRPYVAFDLSGRRSHPHLKSLDGGIPDNPEAVQAFDAYRDAYEALFNHDRLPEARVLVDTARRLQPREALYHFAAGVLALMARDARPAATALDEAVALGHPDPERLAAFHLWRARALDLLAQRPRAVADYQAAGSGDPAVQRAAEQGKRRVWRGGRISFELAWADAVRP